MVWIGIVLSCLQQLVGINVIFYYGTTLWEAVGFAASDSLAINLVSGAINIGATVLAIALIDRVGRRPLLLWGAVGMVLTLTVLACGLVDGSGRCGRPAASWPRLTE